MGLNLFIGGGHGLFGMKGQREATNELISSVESDDSMKALAPLLERAKQPMTPAQHEQMRAQIMQAVADQRDINDGFEKFTALQGRLRGHAVNQDDLDQLDIMSTQMEYARNLQSSQNPRLAAQGVAIAGSVLAAQQQYADNNEAQRVAAETLDASTKAAIGAQNWAEFSATRDQLTKESAPYLSQRTAYGQMKAMLGSDTEQSDYGLLFAWNKVLDPNSSVREGAFANAQNLAGVPSMIVTMLNQLRDGKRLTAEQRADIFTQATATYNTSVQEQTERNGRYAASLKELGVPERTIDTMMIPTTSPGAAPANFGSAAPDPRGQAGASGSWTPSPNSTSLADNWPRVDAWLQSILDKIPANILHHDGRAGESGEAYDARKQREADAAAARDVYPKSGVIARLPTDD